MIFISLLLSVSLDFSSAETSFNKLYPILNEYVRDFPKDFRKIPEDRRYRLNEIVYYLQEQQQENNQWQLLFIDTHQSAISQLVQVWAKTAAFYFGFQNLGTFSGGLTPETISVGTITSLEKAGCIVYRTDVNGTDVYRVKYSYNIDPIVIFPKKIDHVRNPSEEFMAIFVEENADLNVQNIRGTYNRLLLSHEDPTGYKDVSEEEQMYEKSCRKVAVEMFYVFSQLRKRLKEN